MTNDNTLVNAGGKHKITYEWRSFLGFIGSWKEVKSISVSKPDIHVVTTRGDYNQVFINGKEYVLKP